MEDTLLKIIQLATLNTPFANKSVLSYHLTHSGSYNLYYKNDGDILISVRAHLIPERKAYIEKLKRELQNTAFFIANEEDNSVIGETTYMILKK